MTTAIKQPTFTTLLAIYLKRRDLRKVEPVTKPKKKGVYV